MAVVNSCIIPFSSNPYGGLGFWPSSRQNVCFVATLEIFLYETEGSFREAVAAITFQQKLDPRVKLQHVLTSEA